MTRWSAALPPQKRRCSGGGPEHPLRDDPDGVYIAYQVVGEGPSRHRVAARAWPGNVDFQWENPLDRTLPYDAGVVLSGDQVRRRGSGISDSVPEDDPPDLETRIDGSSEPCWTRSRPIASCSWRVRVRSDGALLAATDPARVHSRVWIRAVPRGPCGRRTIPWGRTKDDYAAALADLERDLGDRSRTCGLCSAELANDEETHRWLAKASRIAMSPGTAAVVRADVLADGRALNPVSDPRATLLVHEGQDAPEDKRYVAALIPDAEFVELPGEDHLAWTWSRRRALEEIRAFIGIERADRVRSGSVLTTVLFTDIVGSTAKQAAIGRSRRGRNSWNDITRRSRHDRAPAGAEVDTSGDGFYATFDGPARAVRCALDIGARVRDLGIEIRAGVHVGECTLIDGKVSGLPVTIGARIAARAVASEVLVSQTVKDLVPGSGLLFEDTGDHELKGVPDRWHLYRVVS